MNKLKTLILLLTIPFFAMSCSNNQPNVEPEEEIVITIGETYKTNYWDKKIDKMIEYTCKDNKDKIPQFITTSYEAVVGYINVDNESLICTQIKCFGVNSSSSNRLYAEKMEEKGFYLSSGNNYGYLMVDYYSDLFLSYSLVSDDTNPYFIIQMFVRETREKDWNSNLVRYIAEIDIPVCEAESYNTSYDQYYDRLVIYANFVEADSASKYVTLLQSNKFYVTAIDSSGAVKLTHIDGFVSITVYQTYGDYNCHAVYIAVSNAWPAVHILSFTDLINFPKLESDTASYDGWDYFDPYGEGIDTDYTIRIFYLNASSVDYSNYLDSLVTYGLNKGETSTSESGIVSTYLTVIRPSDNYIIEIGLLYQISTNTICVVIYQAYKA